MYEFKTKPFTHQRNALKAARNKKAFAYLMEMGTGKSKVIIDEIGILHSEGEIDCAVILAPKGVYMNWVLGEIPIHLGIDADVVAWYSGGGNKSQQRDLARVLEPKKSLRILVMNIEALSSGAKAANYLERFLSSGRSYMAIDESTLIKNPGSNRTKKVTKIGRAATYRRIATGSPVTRSPLDLYPQFDFLESRLLGSSSFYSFRARYAVMEQKDFGGRKFSVVVGFRNVEELTPRVEQHSFRVMKEECMDLPPKVYTRRDVDLTDEQRRAYQEMKTAAFAEIGEGFASAQSAITILLRLHQITCGHVTDSEGDIIPLKSNRVNVLMDAVAETDRDVIIWARYRHDIKSITEALRKEYGDDSVAEFHGGNTQTRHIDADNFKNSPECRFMVSNQQSGGYGNTWVNAKTVIYFSNDYDLEKRLQSEDRAHRSGQTDSVTYVDLVANGTVDEKILNALRKKINIADTIMGDDYREWIV